MNKERVLLEDGVGHLRSVALEQDEILFESCNVEKSYNPDCDCDILDSE